MTSDIDQHLSEPPQVRTIRIMVLVLLGVMIAAIIIVVTLFVIRFSQTPSSVLGTDFIAIKNGEQIEIYETGSGRLHQTITVKEP